MNNKTNLFSLIFSLIIIFSTQFVLGQTKPNVIIVITDDQGYGEVAAHGNDIIKTPNMDILHGESVRLTNFHVDPTCSPTRAALLTGHYSRRTGVWHTISGRSLLRHDQVVFADVFKDAGYRTGMFGKWHMGDNYPMRPSDLGFDHVVYHKGGGVGQGPDYFGNDYGQYDNNTTADTYFLNNVPKEYKGYCTDIWFNEAMKFIEDNKDTSFLVYLSTNAPHNPQLVDSKYSNPYVGKGVTEKFYGMITNIDENLGYLMAKLKALNIEENTILIFLTDNGSANPTFNAGMRGKKGNIFDGGHRVPFFIRWPAGNLKHGTNVNNITAHIDLFPTLLSLAGIPKPSGLEFDGVDISPLLRGQSTGWPARKIVVESQRIQTPVKYKVNLIMTDEWRLINNSDLYNINSDPGQKTSVAAANPALVKELNAVYESWWTDVASRDKEFVEIILGSKYENPSTLMAHDWHPYEGEHSIYDQSWVINGKVGTGWFAVKFDQSGTYKFELRRWPHERGGSLEFGNTAKLIIGDKNWTKPFNSTSDEMVNFEVDIEAGSTRLEASLDDTHGAYYVYVTKITGCMDPKYAEFDPTVTKNDPSQCKTTSNVPVIDTFKNIKFQKDGILVKVEGTYSIWIHDMSGRLIKEIHGHGKQEYNLEGIKKPGVYILKIKMNSGDVIQKFMNF